jgi:competence CoiA-like predicted nuclease
MLYAIDGNDKIEASPGAHAICPNCDKNVFAKCGEINIWHWAHLKNEACDGWYEPETLWHKNWKLAFGKDNSEISIRKDGIRHIADILTKSNVVIELQNSPLQKQVIRRRENFYGERMIWLINGAPFCMNFTWIQKHHDIKWKMTSEGWLNITTGEIKPNLQQYTFFWSWARKSWKFVQRPVLIDFGGDKLFWVKEGMGSSMGHGVQVLKSTFLEKYEGNQSLLELLTN